MALPTEPGIYTGTAGLSHNTTLLAHTTGRYMPRFKEVVLTSTPLLKSMALAAFGKKAVIGDASFGNVTKSSGKGIVFNDGGSQFEGPLMTALPSMNMIDRMGNVNPEYVDPAKTWAYAWERGIVSVFLPEEHVLDNVGPGKLMSRLETKMKLAQLAAVRDVSYILHGSSSAPTGAPQGLPHLVAVTQTNAIGGITASPSSTWWSNQLVASTGIGGGGELDRPIQLLRDMENLLLTIRNKSGASNEQTLVGTRGAYQYYARAAYADQHGTAGLNVGDYYDAGIDHLVFHGRPFIYDADTTVPTGATASTECIYFLDYNELGLSIKKNEYFKQEGWEAPRAHDKQRYFQLNILVRLTPYCSNRRVQGVLYNMTANPDAS